jgi:hypothetical protein
MNRSFSIDWWLWLFFTGASIGAVTRYFCFLYPVRNDLTVRSVKMIGLFVTALVGLYTIEDLWEKFGDTKMSVVSILFFFSYAVRGLTFHPARSSKTLGCPHTMPYHCSDSCLHGVVQNPFHGPQPFWTRRCANEFSFPSQP